MDICITCTVLYYSPRFHHRPCTVTTTHFGKIFVSSTANVDRTFFTIRAFYCWIVVNVFDHWLLNGFERPSTIGFNSSAQKFHRYKRTCSCHVFVYLVILQNTHGNFAENLTINTCHWVTYNVKSGLVFTNIGRKLFSQESTSDAYIQLGMLPINLVQAFVPPKKSIIIERIHSPIWSD